MLGKSASARSFGTAYLPTCAIQNGHFHAKVEGALRFSIIQNAPALVNLTNCVLEKGVLFE